MNDLDLACRYVAMVSLHSARTPAEVLTAVHEIVINLIGSELFGVYGLHGNATLELHSTFGLDRTRSSLLEAQGIVLEALELGVPTIAEHDADWPRNAPLACVPLMVDGTAFGAVVVFGLLPQKPQLEAADREILDLIAAYAGPALVSTFLRDLVAAGGVDKRTVLEAAGMALTG